MWDDKQQTFTSETVLNRWVVSEIDSPYSKKLFVIV